MNCWWNIWKLVVFVHNFREMRCVEMKGTELIQNIRSSCRLLYLASSTSCFFTWIEAKRCTTFSQIIILFAIKLMKYLYKLFRYNNSQACAVLEIFDDKSTCYFYMCFTTRIKQIDCLLTCIWYETDNKTHVFREIYF